jgi:hypothetical protein
MRTRPERDPQQKPQSVYSIQCERGRSYIGETGRPLAVPLQGYRTLSYLFFLMFLYNNFSTLMLLLKSAPVVAIEFAVLQEQTRWTFPRPWEQLTPTDHWVLDNVSSVNGQCPTAIDFIDEWYQTSFNVLVQRTEIILNTNRSLQGLNLSDTNLFETPGTFKCSQSDSKKELA